MQNTGLKIVPAAVIAAFRHVQSVHPYLAEVRYDEELRWCYTDLEGTAFTFGGNIINIGLLEDAADAVETAPITYSLRDIVHSEGRLVQKGASLAKLYGLWEKLGDVPTTPSGKWVDCTEEPFLHFPAGTHRENIWRWFESVNSKFIVGEVMQGILHDSDPRMYLTSVRTDFDYDDIPEAVEFAIDEDSAREIVRFAQLVKQNDLHKIEKFDYRATYLKHDPEESPDEAAEAGSDNEVSTDAGTLKVTRTEFWFGAYVKHTCVELLSERQSVSELAAHFGIAFEQSA